MTIHRFALFCHGYYKSQIRLRKNLQRYLIALLNSASQFNFFFSGY